MIKTTDKQTVVQITKLEHAEQSQSYVNLSQPKCSLALSLSFTFHACAYCILAAKG